MGEMYTQKGSRHTRRMLDVLKLRLEVGNEISSCSALKGDCAGMRFIPDTNIRIKLLPKNHF